MSASYIIIVGKESTSLLRGVYMDSTYPHALSRGYLQTLINADESIYYIQVVLPLGMSNHVQTMSESSDSLSLLSSHPDLI